MCTITGGKAIRVCVRRHDQTALTANDEARSDAHIASKGMPLYYRTPKVAT